MVKNFLRLLAGLVSLGSAVLQADTTIAAANFNATANVSGGLYVINQPGIYILGADVKLPVGRSNVAMIQIATSNVTLDLNGKSLSLSGTNRMPCAQGISIVGNSKNVVIKNGLISGSNGLTRVVDGISCLSAENVSIQNVIVKGCGRRGFFADACRNFLITDSMFSNLYVTAGTATTYGFLANECSDFVISNVSCSFNKSTVGATCGMFLYRCTDFVCENVKANGNQGIANPLEAFPNPINNVAACAGISLRLSRHNKFLHCAASENFGSTREGALAGYGFLLDQSRDNVIDGCSACSNTGGARVAGIAVLNATANKIKACIANDNFSVFSASAYGILVENDGQSNERFGASVIECEAFGNRSTDQDDGNAYGIAFIGMHSGSIERCTVGTNWSCNAYGIALLSVNPGGQNPKPTGRINVCNNTILHNPGTTKRYGFYDDASPTTSFLRGNIAYGHGVKFNRHGNESTSCSNFYFDYDNGQNYISGIEEKNTLLGGYSVSDTDTWVNCSIN